MLPRDHELFKRGTEKDGSENELYCSMCYEKGVFTQPEITTAKEMQDFVKDVLKKQGIGRLKRWFYTVSIPKLKRWN
jgi:hypothetical protein